jgi:hypothetical protein
LKRLIFLNISAEKITGGVFLKSDARRLITAVFLSALSFGLTFGWYYLSKPKIKIVAMTPPIAFVQKTTNEVHKKSVARALWQPAEDGDQLRFGDAIRTSTKGEIKIQFINSDRYLELEADSLVVIQQNEKEISLDLMEGSVYVNSSTTDKNDKMALAINTKGGKVDISKTTAFISGSSSSKLDVKVIKGEAVFKKEGQKAETIDAGKTGGIGMTGMRVNSEKVRILYPDTTKPHYINADSPTPLKIKWEGFPQDAQVVLESGTSRKNLFPTPTEKIGPNEIQTNFTAGNHYWKLKAVDPDTRSVLSETSIFKTDVIARFAPIPIAPEPNFIIQTRRNMETINLKWGVGPEFKEVLVELYNESTNQQILNKRFPATQDSTELQNLSLSNYKWKLTGFTEEGNQVLAGQFTKFSIQEKRIVKIPIAWNANTKSIQYYVNTEPKLGLQWGAEDMERISKWKLHLAPEGRDLAKGEVIETTHLKFERVLKQKGRFIASVEALDSDGDTIGVSESRTFVVDELPLLAAPTVMPEAGDFLAKSDGTLGVEWNGVDGAKIYHVLVRDQTGKIVVENSSETVGYKLNNLMPGTYDLQIGATDSYGRRGNLSVKRRLLVPDKSEVKAPKLRKIKVN